MSEGMDSLPTVREPDAIAPHDHAEAERSFDGASFCKCGAYRYVRALVDGSWETLTPWIGGTNEAEGRYPWMNRRDIAKAKDRR